MKNTKIILVFTLIVALLFAMATLVKASNDTPLTIISNNTTTTNNDANTQQPANNTQNTQPVVNNNVANTNVATNTLPQTGITENVTLTLFIAVAIISAIYAFIRIRNYKNI